MEESDLLRLARSTLAGICPETVEAAVIVHAGPGKSGLKLKHSNYLALTPTSLRLYSLGGRTGTKPKKELACWPRTTTRVDVEMVDHSAFFASTGSSIRTRRYRLRVTLPDTKVFLEGVADAGLTDLDREWLEAGAAEAEPDPEVREAIEGLQELDDETNALVRAFVDATGGEIEEQPPDES